MNINIYVEDQIGQQLSSYSKKLHRKKNSIIREAIKDWIAKQSNKQWSKSILQFNGIEDFPDIKELRKNLNEPKNNFF